MQRQRYAVDPVLRPRVTIAPDNRVATAGSCFAQHLSHALRARGVAPMVTEPGIGEDEAFPARFGNIYSTRQLLQLLQRAYGLFAPLDTAWRRADGRFIDPFRPLVHPPGFADVAALDEDRKIHLSAVRAMFEDCDVFVFTLGLTEQWRAVLDGATVPVVPGAVSATQSSEYRFHNAAVGDMTEDLARFIDHLRLVNPSVRIILTVSPVPLVATYEDSHVLVANTYSKAALRVTAEEISRRFPDVDYFPSYEMIAGPQGVGCWFDDDLRTVTQAGVDHVMSLFAAHYLTTRSRPTERHATLPERQPSVAAEAHLRFMQGVICDEERNER
jgi:hypothetical protein